MKIQAALTQHLKSAVAYAACILVIAVTWMAACQPDAREPAATTEPAAATTRAATHLATRPAAATPAASTNRLVAAARAQIGVTTGYAPAYRVLTYPRGDVPISSGVCTDVLIRALRQQNIDLQQSVHEDMTAHFADYPQKWSLTAPDKNIDHRRVLNLMTFFDRRGYQLPLSKKPETYSPGDIVTWDLGSGVMHIGIVSDRKSSAGTPLVIHNIGRGTQEQDILFEYTIRGHYRIPALAVTAHAHTPLAAGPSIASARPAP